MTTPGAIKGHTLWSNTVAAFAVTLKAEEWMAEAACRSVDPKLFFSPTVNGTAQAKAICARCPVIADCRRWNDEIEMVGMGARGGASGLAGVYAAETPKERVARRRG